MGEEPLWGARVGRGQGLPRGGVALGLLWAACSPVAHKPSGAAPADALVPSARLPSGATATGSAEPPASASSVALPVPSAAPPASVVVGSDPTRLQCRRVACKVGSETCCEAGDEGRCVATVAPGPNDRVQRLASQIDACEKEKRTLSLSSMSRCDESLDCGKSDLCCQQFVFGGASASLCTPARGGGQSPCDVVERCIEGHPCRTPGATCVEGQCLKKGAIRCGKKVCSGKASVCCGEPLDCREPARCGEGGPKIRCTRPGDCLKGQACMASPVETFCTGFIDMANLSLVCERSSDCPTSGFMGCPDRAMECKAESFEGVRVCRCP